MTPRLNLHDALERVSFDHAVICTFTFEPQFFEGYCLDRFNSLAENNNVTVIVDRCTYDALIQAPASEWPRLANVRYLLHPVDVRGTFHPKLFLFATKCSVSQITPELANSGFVISCRDIGWIRR